MALKIYFCWYLLYMLIYNKIHKWIKFLKDNFLNTLIPFLKQFFSALQVATNRWSVYLYFCWIQKKWQYFSTLIHSFIWRFLFFDFVSKCSLFGVGCHVTCPKIFREEKHRASTVSWCRSRNLLGVHREIGTVHTTLHPPIFVGIYMLSFDSRAFSCAISVSRLFQIRIFLFSIFFFECKALSLLRICQPLVD